MNNPSICIPKVSININSRFIKEVFTKANIGKIKNIHFRRARKSNIVYIEFHYWYNNEISINIKNRLIKGEPVNIVYDFPWFWKCIKI